MRSEFLEVETMNDAEAAAPWAAKIIEVEGGFHAFESMTDYQQWMRTADLDAPDGVFEYEFRTDSEHGVICAGSFLAAQRELMRMVPDEAIADGAWGWVQDADGNRFSLGSC